MKTSQPMSRIEMIERSLRCFELALVGLLPFIGLPAAALAALQYGRVKRGQGEMWNPAHRYLFWGGVCARMSLGIFLVVPAALVLISLVWHF